ncbi:hematopoietic cell signal transducer [Cololabis saira]|uniref:hematopoietic cell signal transducer n=1 Tax=Cololabis saira TaxID=129043 RepID=UPI002AD51FB4|nr:hematopoietic cell signal transducer [Cololabis saira]
MAYKTLFIIALLFISNLAVALTDQTTPCYRIEPGTIAGIICVDVLLTLIIIVVTYRCAMKRQKINNANKVYMNVRANYKGNI